MSLLHKIGHVAQVLRDEGLRGTFSILISRYAPPSSLTPEFRWKSGIRSELRFWDAYFRTKGLEWGDTYAQRLDPDLPLQPRPASLLPPEGEVRILDVGAGPVTYLGKKLEGRRIVLTAVDPLAEEFDRILAKYGVEPPVRTGRLAAEDLGQRFAPDTFDLVFARNCIDHAYDPERAVLQMIDVVKVGRYVLMEHRQNEAEKEGYSGLHQWNFSVSTYGDFLIRSRSTSVNMSEKYADLCTMVCEVVSEPGDGEWLVTRVLKKGPIPHHGETPSISGTFRTRSGQRPGQP